MHVIAINEVEAINLKRENKGVCEGLEFGKGREKCCNYNVKPVTVTQTYNV